MQLASFITEDAMYEVGWSEPKIKIVIMIVSPSQEENMYRSESLCCSSGICVAAPHANAADQSHHQTRIQQPSRPFHANASV